MKRQAKQNKRTGLNLRLFNLVTRLITAIIAIIAGFLLGWLIHWLRC